MGVEWMLLFGCGFAVISCINFFCEVFERAESIRCLAAGAEFFEGEDAAPHVVDLEGVAFVQLWWGWPSRVGGGGSRPDIGRVDKIVFALETIREG